MVRKGFTFNETTNKNKITDNNNIVDCDDTDKRSVINGYKKLVIMIFLFTVVIFFRTHIFDIVSVNGDSMKNSFLQGDMLLVKKYDIKDIEKYDVVVAKIKSQNVIKRVIGLPNETVYIDNGAVYINGEKIEGEFDFFTEYAGVASEPYKLGENEYFLMGDNRSGSADSREYGFVNFANIKGIVFYRIYPFSRIENYSR